jgi:zinc-ribbon domain
MNYSTQVGNPTAHITKKKSRLKVYNGHIVLLNDKDNFELEIYNPKQQSVLAKIKLNGKYISESGVVLKPGQRVFLERFLDSNNKFQFSTYEVENTPQNKSAIDLNGLVTIEFYDEQIPQHINYTTGTRWYGTLNNSITNSPTYNSVNYSTNPNGIMFTNTNGVVLTNTSNTSSINLETGRVEKGFKSSQDITSTYENFNYYTTFRVEYKILPKSSNPVEVHEIRNYCTECGTKIKTNYKFCPSCGNKL